MRVPANRHAIKMLSRELINRREELWSAIAWTIVDPFLGSSKGVSFSVSVEQISVVPLILHSSRSRFRSLTEHIHQD